MTDSRRGHVGLSGMTFILISRQISGFKAGTMQIE